MSTLTCPIRSKCPSDKMFWNVLDGVCSLFQAGYRPASPQPAMRVWENPRTRPAPHLRLISASFLSLRVGQHGAMINLNNSRRQSYDQMRLAQGITEKLRQCLAMPELHGWVPWGVSWSNRCHRRAYETSWETRILACAYMALKGWTSTFLPVCSESFLNLPGKSTWINLDSPKSWGCYTLMAW